MESTTANIYVVMQRLFTGNRLVGNACPKGITNHNKMTSVQFSREQQNRTYIYHLKPTLVKGCVILGDTELTN